MNRTIFSKREAQVVQLLMEGKSNKQIAVNLSISESTVEFHLTRIYAKLGVSSRAEALIHLGQPGLPRHDSWLVNMGETPGEKLANRGETPGEFITGNVYAGGEQILMTKGSEMPGSRSLFPRNYAIPLIFGITFVLIAAVGLYLYQAVPKTWQGYARECEYPDKSTGGRTIGRSSASGERVHGQFGAIDVEPWSAIPGDAVYENIGTPQVEQLYLKLRYSKNSPPQVPILLYLDHEKTARASIYPENQNDWNRFAWTDPVFLGSVESGVHTITFSTAGQQYGVADLDKFILLAGSP